MQPVGEYAHPTWLGHGETKDTQCPGRYLRPADVRAAVQRILSGEPQADEAERLASGEW
jgi:hypothetical protein